jgi:hypothetical protein
MYWDGEEHQFYQMCKLLTPEVIDNALQTVLPPDVYRGFVEQAQAQAKAQAAIAQ